MVNASLNWASIVGIVLAVCGAGLYFLRSFKPALARDYDVFFAAIGLLCGGILFFQGWRLDPILQFGQFLLAGTTVFFAYESVRLRGISTDQARKSAYFDEDPQPVRMGSGGIRRGWEDSYDQFEESPAKRRRFSSRDDFPSNSQDDDFYQERQVSRRAIPEQAASRTRLNEKGKSNSWDSKSSDSRRMARFDSGDFSNQSRFGERRNIRQQQRRGSRPISNTEFSNRRDKFTDNKFNSDRQDIRQSSQRQNNRPKTEDAAFYPASNRSDRFQKGVNNPSFEKRNKMPRNNSTKSSPRNRKVRDNNSQFDD